MLRLPTAVLCALSAILASNNYFPRVSGEGTVPVSFPLSSGANQFRIYPGDRPTTVAIVRVCLERSLFINHCIDGATIAGSIDHAHNATISVNNRELIVNGTAPGPYFEVSPKLMTLLRPASDLPLRFVQICRFLRRLPGRLRHGFPVI